MIDWSLVPACTAALAIGYLCKHNATLSAAEGGCQAEIGVASAMGAALIAAAYGDSPQVAANGAEGALEHHLIVPGRRERHAGKGPRHHVGGHGLGAE